MHDRRAYSKANNIGNGGKEGSCFILTKNLAKNVPDLSVSRLLILKYVFKLLSAAMLPKVIPES